MSKSLNLKDAPDTSGDFTPLPVGRYPAETEEAVKSLSDNGNDVVTVTLNIIDGEHKGRKMWDKFTWLDSTIWKIKGFLLSAKSDLAQDPDLTIPKFMAAVNRGLKTSMYVTTKKYEGKVSNVIKSYSSLEEPETEETANEGSLFK